MNNLPFVWELDYQGVQSHLVGTMHFLPNWSSVPDFKPAADELLRGKEHFLQELYLPEIDIVNKIRIMSAVSGQKFGDYLGTFGEEEKLLLAKTLGVTPSDLEKRPTMMLTAYLLQAAKISPVDGVEEILQHSAEKKDIKIASLETVDEQIACMKEVMDGTSEAFRNIIDKEKRQPGFFKGYYPKVFESYLSGNEEDLLFSGSQIYERTPPSMIQRNRNMVQRSLSYLVEPTVVAVGAFHCLGEDSMINFYRENDVTVRRV